MKAAIFRTLVLGITFVLSACGGGGAGSSATPSSAPPPIVSFSHVFPQGDATAAQGTAWDIVGVKTTLSGQFGDGAGQLYDTLRVDVTFAQDISSALPLPGQPLRTGSKLGVGISFDTDENPATGVFDTCANGSGIHPYNYGTSNGSAFGRLTDGNYPILGEAGQPIYSGTSNPPEEAITVVSGNILSQTIFLPSIGVAAGAAIPKIGLGIAALNGVDGATDCVPGGNAEIFTDRE